MCGANPGDLVRVSAGFESVPRVRATGVNCGWFIDKLSWWTDWVIVLRLGQVTGGLVIGIMGNLKSDWLIHWLAIWLSEGLAGRLPYWLQTASANGWLVLLTSHWNYSLNKLACQLFPITAMLRHTWTEFLKIWMEFSILHVGFVNSSRDSEFPWEFCHIYGNKELQHIILFEMLHIRTILGFYACSEVFSLTRDFQSAFQRDLQGVIQISDVTKKCSNVHFSLVACWPCVTENGCKSILSLLLKSDILLFLHGVRFLRGECHSWWTPLWTSKNISRTETTIDRSVKLQRRAW